MTDAPQLENGYLRIANELYEQIMLANFTKRELLVVLAIIRETYGYGRKEHRISGTQVGKLTGIQRDHASRTIAILCRRKVVLKQTHRGYNVLSINKIHKQWLPPEASAKTAHVPKQTQASAKTDTNLCLNQHTTKDSKNRSKDRGAIAPPLKGRRWLQDEAVPESWIAWAVSQGFPDPFVRTQAESFHDHWISKSGKDSTKLDWQATWRNWFRRPWMQQHKTSNDFESVGAWR